MRGSRRQYAAHRKELGLTGTSHVAVGKAVDSGRIREGADGLIDFEEADRLWAANTRPAEIARNPSGVKKEQQPTTAAPSPAPPKPSSSRPQEPTAPLPNVEGGAGVSLVKAQTMKAVFSAQREKLRFEEESKQKIDANDVRLHAFARGRQARDKLLAAANRIGPRVFGLTDMVQTITILEDELRQLAQEISDESLTPI